MGEVTNVQQLQAEIESGWHVGLLKGLFALVLLVFRPLLAIGGWLLSGASQRQMQTVYVLTVRRSDGLMEQARMEGECRGAMPSLGDQLSLWGRRRHGVLIVDVGFNHNVGAGIVVRAYRDRVAAGCLTLVAALAALFGLMLLAAALGGTAR